MRSEVNDAFSFPSFGFYTLSKLSVDTLTVSWHFHFRGCKNQSQADGRAARPTSPRHQLLRLCPPRKHLETRRGNTFLVYSWTLYIDANLSIPFLQAQLAPSSFFFYEFYLLPTFHQGIFTFYSKWLCLYISYLISIFQFIKDNNEYSNLKITRMLF